MWSHLMFVAIIASELDVFGECVSFTENGASRLFNKSRSVENGMVPMGQGRVVGGNYVPIETVPWTCSQQRFGSHRCGCAIVAPAIAITAAHCANHIPGNGFYIRAGSDSKNRDGQLIPTREVSIHPSFDETILEHDICVMFLASSFNTAVPSVSPITMQSGGASLPSGTMSMVSGWGPLHENGAGSEILRSVTHPVYSSLECSERHGGGLTHDMLCAGLDAGGAAACDAGSPLISGGVLVGVMSWSTGCGRPLLPSVYSRISTARFWIDFTINEHT